MTIDKIRHYIGEDLYKFWSAQTNLLLLNEARTTLRQELKDGILPGIKYHAELKLLDILIGDAEPFEQPTITPEHQKAIERTEQFNTIEN